MGGTIMDEINYVKCPEDKTIPFHFTSERQISFKGDEISTIQVVDNQLSFKLSPSMDVPEHEFNINLDNVEYYTLY